MAGLTCVTSCLLFIVVCCDSFASSTETNRYSEALRTREFSSESGIPIERVMERGTKERTDRSSQRRAVPSPMSLILNRSTETDSRMSRRSESLPDPTSYPDDPSVVQAPRLNSRAIEQKVIYKLAGQHTTTRAASAVYPTDHFHHDVQEEEEREEEDEEEETSEEDEDPEDSDEGNVR